jgi:hypothetical protein
MAWSLAGSPRVSGDRERWRFRPSLSLSSPVGVGLEITGALLDPEAAIPALVLGRGDSATDPDPAAPQDRLEQRLPEPITQLHAKGITHVASLLGIPSGFEEVGAFREYVSKPFPRPEHGISSEPAAQELLVPVAGLTFRQALDAYVAVDRRYEWREMDGVVVMRPVESWGRGDHLLGGPAGPAHLRDARISQAFDALRSAVDASRRWPALPFGDEERISVEFAGGTVLELVNAIVRANGRLSWSLTSEEGLFPLERSTTVWIVEPELTLQTETGGMSIPLSRPSADPSR